MIDIEVGRARVYFSVENRTKMGAGRLGYAKYNFWGQNGVVLSIITFFFNSKQRHFVLSGTKTTSFGLVLTYPKRRCLYKCLKQRRFGPKQP